ncbi:MAG: hypothetical protein IT410_04200 [Candidatus Doudnabacteria bacterium]|nr:hypothetical protein [Candidatus Doudnabacteria bacterium]
MKWFIGFLSIVGSLVVFFCGLQIKDYSTPDADLMFVTALFSFIAGLTFLFLAFSEYREERQRASLTPAELREATIAQRLSDRDSIPPQA